MVAHTPGHRAALGSLVRLALDARIHNMVSTDSAVVDVDIPGPQSHGIPFLHLEYFFL